MSHLACVHQKNNRQITLSYGIAAFSVVRLIKKHSSCVLSANFRSFHCNVTRFLIIFISWLIFYKYGIVFKHCVLSSWLDTYSNMMPNRTGRKNKTRTHFNKHAHTHTHTHTRTQNLAMQAPHYLQTTLGFRFCCHDAECNTRQFFSSFSIVKRQQTTRSLSRWPRTTWMTGDWKFQIIQTVNCWWWKFTTFLSWLFLFKKTVFLNHPGWLPFKQHQQTTNEQTAMTSTSVHLRGKCSVS